MAKYSSIIWFRVFLIHSVRLFIITIYMATTSVSYIIQRRTRSDLSALIGLLNVIKIIDFGLNRCLLNQILQRYCFFKFCRSATKLG